MTSHQDSHDDDFDLVNRGPSARLWKSIPWQVPSAHQRLVKIGLLVLLTWLPLALFALAEGNITTDDVRVPFLQDPEVHARFLIVLPLLELANVVVAVSLAVQAEHFLSIGIVSAADSSRFQSVRGQVLRMRESFAAEIALVVIAYTISIILRFILEFSDGESSWEMHEGKSTLAGWWYMLVSLPLLYFLLLRWAWVFALWAWFLFRVSRLDLKLTNTHPDRAGGLGFVAWGLVSFALVVAAIASVFSAAFADEILHRGESLQSLKYHIATFAIVVVGVLHAPLLAFSGKLGRCRFKGLLDYGALAWRYDQAFEEKWIVNPTGGGDALLGSSDVQSLADIGTCYEHADRMWLMPFDTKAFAVLLLAALVPMIPLVGTAVPLAEIFEKLGVLLV